MRARRLCSALLAVLLLAGCGPATQAVPTPAPPSAVSPTATAPAGGARFEEAACPFEVPDGEEARCGYLVVPEDRREPAGRTIRLAVAVFESHSSSPAPDPIVYLEGGPGGSPLRANIPYFGLLYSPLLEKRDLILFDQRGTGYSQPALDCPEYIERVVELLDDDIPADQQQVLADQALRACRDRLAAEGVNLAAYTSAENAADLNDLRLALGYEEWNLYGVSYGTRLALTAMRDFPGGIRSVVLDSVFPLQANLVVDTPANAARALDVLFDSCAADAACSGAYPDLRGTFFDLVDRLNSSPVSITVTLPSGERGPALLNGDSLIGVLFQALYATPLIPMLPEIIHQADQGSFGAVAAVQSQLLDALTDVSHGMYNSVQCAEDVPFGTPAQLNAALAEHPELSAAFGGAAADDIFDLCQDWGTRPADAVENEPVHSDIPALILGGQYDPVTPPAWGQMAAETLSRSFFFELPGAGHGASLTEECPRSVLLAFLDRPTARPEASCIQQEMGPVAFHVPAGAAELRLVPFASTDLGIRGLRPAAWKELAPGTYSPTGLETDQTAIVQFAIPLPADQVLELLRAQLSTQGVDIPAEESGDRQSQGMSWTLYQVQVGLSFIDLSLAEREGVTYVVMLQSLLTEHEALYAGLFLPCVDALGPSE